MESTTMHKRTESEDLTDDQIMRMLQEAEARLKNIPGSASALTLVTDDVTQQFQSNSQTRLSTGNGLLLSPYIKSNKDGAHIDSSKTLSASDRLLASRPRVVADSTLVQSKKAKENKPTAGENWYDLPRTNLTPELKRDFQLLRMRSVLDPKRHYKKGVANKNQIPEFSQIGTIIEGPTEYFSARLSNKERKRTLLEEVMDGEKSSQRFKSKYRDIQEAKTSGRKDHYKSLKAQRRKSTSKG